MVGKSCRALLPLALTLFSAAVISCGKATREVAVEGYEMIDNMEAAPDPLEPLGRIQWPPPNGWRPGFWSSSTDCSQAHRILPEPFFVNPFGWYYSTVPHPYQTMPGVTSTHAARLRTKFGEPLQGIWGANMGFDLAENPGADGGIPWYPAVGLDGGAPAEGQPCRQGSSRDFNGAPVDLSAFPYSGITFWAMASPNGRQSIRVQINNERTDPRAGQCNGGDPGEDKAACYNGYGKAIMLTSTFTQYWVDFSELRQNPSWGDSPNAVPLVPDGLQTVYSVSFGVDLPGCAIDPVATCAGEPAPVSFDIWIDDLYFVTRP